MNVFCQQFAQYCFCFHALHGLNSELLKNVLSISSGSNCASKSCWFPCLSPRLYKNVKNIKLTSYLFYI